MKKNKNIKKTRSAQNFNYTGDITIKLIDGERVYSEKQYHNTGSTKLFNFLTNCLMGNFTIAKSSRPCRIVLFKAALDEIDGNDEWLRPDNFPNNLRWDDDTKISMSVLYDSAITPGASEEDGSSIIYHFRVPYLSLVSGEKVRKLAIYPDTISSYKSDRCAYYLLDADEGIEIPGPDGANGNFTIIIDWKLHIYNAPKL